MTIKVLAPRPVLAVFGREGRITAADVLAALADLGGTCGRTQAEDARRAWDKLAEAARCGLLTLRDAERLSGLVYASSRYAQITRNRRTTK